MHKADVGICLNLKCPLHYCTGPCKLTGNTESEDREAYKNTVDVLLRRPSQALQS